MSDERARVDECKVCFLPNTEWRSGPRRELLADLYCRDTETDEDCTALLVDFGGGEGDSPQVDQLFVCIAGAGGGPGHGGMWGPNVLYHDLAFTDMLQQAQDPQKRPQGATWVLIMRWWRKYYSQHDPCLQQTLHALQMAKQMARTERGKCPKVSLVGWSFGGSVALKTCCTLVDAGEHVDAVVTVASSGRQDVREELLKMWKKPGRRAQQLIGPPRFLICAETRDGCIGGKVGRAETASRRYGKVLADLGMQVEVVIAEGDDHGCTQIQPQMISFLAQGPSEHKPQVAPPRQDRAKRSALSSRTGSRSPAVSSKRPAAPPCLPLSSRSTSRSTRHVETDVRGVEVMLEEREKTPQWRVSFEGSDATFTRWEVQLSPTPDFKDPDLAAFKHKPRTDGWSVCFPDAGMTKAYARVRVFRTQQGSFGQWSKAAQGRG